MRVVRVGLATVKGTRHTAYDAVELDAAGAVGDRVLCLVDPLARRVLRTVENPSLVAVRARWDGTRLDVTLPSGESASGVPAQVGESVTCDYWGRSVALELLDGPHAALLSSHLGRPVRLAAAPRGGVVYAGSVSLVTTASLREVGAHLGAGAGLDAARFRPTVVVDAGDVPFVEDDWLGRELSLGAARIRVGNHIARCAVVDLGPTTGEPDAPVLRTLAAVRPASGPARLGFGVDGGVTAPGPVRAGDEVVVHPRS
jgi:MOSC domain-containing protein